MNTVIIQKETFLDKIAYLQDDTLKKVKIIDKNQKYFEKDIFLAKKKKQNISMKSVLLALDESTDAFMHYKNDENIDYKICQITKVNNNRKNVKVSDEITLLGKYVVYIKGAYGLSISNRSENRQMIDELSKNINQDILQNAKIIIRSNTNPQDIPNIIEEIEQFDNLYKSIENKAQLMSKPKLIFRQYENEEIFLSKINTSINKIITNDRQIAKKLKKSIFSIDEITVENDNLFLKYNVKTQISNLLSDKVMLDNGINLIIQKTDAMNTIDVNSSGYLKYKDKEKNYAYINSYVCKHIVNQIILRDLSGIILIDFIDTKDKKTSENLVKQMQSYLNKDDRKATVSSINKSNIMQIIRKKDDLSLSEILQNKENIKLDSDSYICEQIEETIQNILSQEDERLDENIFQISIPAFENQAIKNNLNILQEKYKIKISPIFLQKDDFTIKIRQIQK